MGVRRYDYIMIGAMVNKKVCTEDFFNNEENENLLYEREHKLGEIAYLYDGYGDDYFIVGIPLQISHDGDGLDLFAFSQSNPKYIEYIRKVQRYVEEKFNEYVEPKLIVLTHYT